MFRPNHLIKWLGFFYLIRDYKSTCLNLIVANRREGLGLEDDVIDLTGNLI